MTDFNVIDVSSVRVGPDECIIILLPAEAFDQHDGESGKRSMAERVATEASTVLGTKRVLVLENTAQITIANLPADEAPDA